jgi:hypothetical protein
MAGLGQKIYTQVLSTNVFVFTQDMGILGISVNLVSGIGTISGTLSIGLNTSVPIDLIIGQPITITSDSGNPLQDITIDCTGGGVINILARQ